MCVCVFFPFFLVRSSFGNCYYSSVIFDTYISVHWRWDAFVSHLSVGRLFFVPFCVRLWLLMLVWFDFRWLLMLLGRSQEHSISLVFYVYIIRLVVWQVYMLFSPFQWIKQQQHKHQHSHFALTDDDQVISEIRMQWCDYFLFGTTGWIKQPNEQYRIDFCFLNMGKSSNWIERRVKKKRPEPNGLMKIVKKKKNNVNNHHTVRTWERKKCIWYRFWHEQICFPFALRELLLLHISDFALIWSGWWCWLNLKSGFCLAFDQ